MKKASGRGLLLEKYIVASPPETLPVDFGAAVQAEALRRGLGRAKKVYVVIDKRPYAPRSNTSKRIANIFTTGRSPARERPLGAVPPNLFAVNCKTDSSAQASFGKQPACDFYSP